MLKLFALLSVLHFLVTYKMSLHAFLTGIRIEGITCLCTVKTNTALDSARNEYSQFVPRNVRVKLFKHHIMKSNPAIDLRLHW